MFDILPKKSQVLWKVRNFGLPGGLGIILADVIEYIGNNNKLNSECEMFSMIDYYIATVVE